jgi:gamma-glutamylcyclotransferase (GGCT)/AIG2-like uncharacterized protein YtfP
MPLAKPFHLFVYGTLMNPTVFRAVLGRRMVLRAADADGVESFLAREAVLDGYKKVSPDHTYLYAVPDPQGRIRGCMIGPLPAQCMTSLLKYEGRNYSRRAVAVRTNDGLYKAVVFVGNLKKMEHSFGYAFHDPFKQEVLLRQKIEAVLLEAQHEQLHMDQDDSVARRAVGELHGDTIRDLIRAHFDSGGVSEYAIRHSIKDAPLRDYDRIRDDPEARALAPNYLAMFLRQIIFNQFEENLRRDFRYELDQMSPGPGFYDRTISSLAVLGMLNEWAGFLNVLVGDCLADLDFSRSHLVDYARWAVAAADSLYDARQARRRLAHIRTHLSPGDVPLGAELEFSNIGHHVILDPEGRSICDPQYDGFIHFLDYGLDILTWKLGGHIDDHHDKVSPDARRGFFEIAMGNVSLGENLSKPITSDPWVLNHMIHEVRRFYPIAPHSVHISLQLRGGHKPVQDRMLPMGVMKCLFAIAGDASLDEEGRLQIKRLSSRDIISGEATAPHLLFSEVRKRFSRQDVMYLGGVNNVPGRFVQQYRFARLSADINYEPLVLALKGLQIALAPGTFLTPAQYQASQKHRDAFEELVAWGVAPTRIPTEEVESFLGYVQDGLMNERRKRPAHNPAYLGWAVGKLRSALERYNALARLAARQA